MHCLLPASYFKFLIDAAAVGYVRHPMYCGLCCLSFGLCAITGSQARLALSVAFWILLNHKARNHVLLLFVWFTIPFMHTAAALYNAAAALKTGRLCNSIDVC